MVRHFLEMQGPKVNTNKSKVMVLGGEKDLHIVTLDERKLEMLFHLSTSDLCYMHTT